MGSNQRDDLLRGNDAANGVTARELNTTVVDPGRRDVLRRECGNGGAQKEGAAAGRAPVGFEFELEHGMAMRADSFHRSCDYRCAERGSAKVRCSR